MELKKDKNKGCGKGKAIISIAVAAIIFASIFGALAPTAARDGSGAIERGDVVFCGEKHLDISAIIASSGWFYGVEGTPAAGDFFFVVDPTDFDVPTTVTVGPYNVTSSEGTVADLYIDEPVITADVFIEGTNYSVVGKTIPTGTKLTVHIEPNFGGLMKNVADGGWSQVKLRLYYPNGMVMSKPIEADASEITVGPTAGLNDVVWEELDTDWWDIGVWKMKITTDKGTCNDVDVSSPYYEFTIRREELSIEAEEAAVDQGEDINLTVTGNPLTYYYLTVTHVDTDNPPEIEDTYDVKVLDTWGEAYPATGTPNLAAWIKTGSDCTANVTINTTGAAERPYRIKVYDTIYPVFPDFVPDEDVEEWDDDRVDIWVGPHETPYEDEWNQTFGGSERDKAYAVQQTTDGGYILAGYTKSYGAGHTDFWLVKTNSNGTELWNNTFGGSGDEEAWDVQQTADGGYILAGYTQSYVAGWYADFWLVKTDSDGNEQWNKTFGGFGWDEAYSVQQTADGGYIIAGGTDSYGSWDAWLVKTDSNGAELWNQTFGGPDGERACAVQQTTDGGYILAGSIDVGWDADFWLIKTDSGGNEQWNKTFGGFDDEEACAVQQTADGSYILAGWTESYGAGDEDFWLVKTDSNGTKLWDKTFGGPYSDEAYAVQQTVDGGYILAGGTSPYDVGGADFWLVKTDSGGNEQWNKTFGSTGHDKAQAAQQTVDGGFILAGYTSSYGAGSYDFWMVKVEREEPRPHALFTYTPKNPFTNQLITFDASSSYDPYGTIPNYEWNFGDGNITNTTEKVITHSYVLEGDYTVNLTVTNSTGAKDSTSKVVSVISPAGNWNRTFGGPGSESADAVQQTADGGYILVGTNSYGAGMEFDDVWLVKTDLYGNELWNRTFGSPGMDRAYSIQQTADGGYIFAGVFDWYYFWLVKTDSNGTELWNRTFGGGDALDVQQTADGGFFSIGIKPGAGDDADFGLVKIDANGDEDWNQTFGGSDNEWASSGQQTPDGGYILTGCTFSYGAGNGDFWLVKTDSTGTELWNRTFGGPYWDWAFSVQQTSDEGYILTGFTESYGTGSSDVWLIKTDPNGNEQWNTTFGGAEQDASYSVVQTSSGQYIVTGGTESYGAGGRDVWLIKTDPNGTEQWNRTFGGYELDEAFSVQQTADGGYVLAGVTESYGAGGADFWLIKVKGEGQTVSIFDTGSPSNPYPSICGTHNGTIMPSCNISVSKLYTYPCAGTGGHTESIEIYDNVTLIANGTWNGYVGDWHNITLTPSVILQAGNTYNYTIVTGSYPQIIHAESKNVTGGTITCTNFTDANGKTYTDWIPAIKLY